MEDMVTQLCYELLLTTYIGRLKAEQEVKASKTFEKWSKNFMGMRDRKKTP